MMYKDIIGKEFNVIIDRKIGTLHPKHADIIYEVNYGYIPNVIAEDLEEQDVYVLGFDQPIDFFKGRVIAVIHRINDVEDKWVMSKNNQEYSKEEIKRLTNFQEKYFDIEIIK